MTSPVFVHASFVFTASRTNFVVSICADWPDLDEHLMERSGMSTQSFLIRFCFVPVLVGMVSGCGGPIGDGYSGKRGEVTGQIMLGDAPLAAGCQVMFVEEAKGYTATGVVDEGGQFDLMYAKGKGLPVGRYRIQISPPVAAPTAAAEAPSDPTEMAAKMKGMMDPKKKKGNDDRLFPAKYSSVTTSELQFKVEEGSNNVSLTLDK